MSFWTDDKVAALRAHKAAGLSAAESCRLLNAVSRHAVIGKRFRLGLCTPMGEHKAKQREVVKGLARAVKRTHAVNYTRAHPKSRPARPNVALGALAEQSRRLTILEVNSRGECKFPTHEDGEHLFCGLPTEDGGVYCPGHARIAFTNVPNSSPAIPNKVTDESGSKVAGLPNHGRIAA